MEEWETETGYREGENLCHQDRIKHQHDETQYRQDKIRYRKIEIEDCEDKVRDMENQRSLSHNTDYHSRFGKSHSLLVDDFKGENDERRDRITRSRESSDLASVSTKKADSEQEQRYPSTPVSSAAGCDSVSIPGQVPRDSSDIPEPMDQKWLKGFEKTNSDFDSWYPLKEEYAFKSPAQPRSSRTPHTQHQAQRDRLTREAITKLWRKTNQSGDWWQDTLLWALQKDQKLALFLLELNGRKQRPWLQPML